MATISENLEALQIAKTNIKNAIENKGQDLTDVPFTQYGEKIEAIQTSNIDLSETTATADDVREGKEFFNASGEKVTGTLVSKLSKLVDKTITTVTEEDLQGITKIGSYAFDTCNNLTSANIPSSVTSIGEYAFRLCKNLNTLTMPSSVTSIGNYAFNSCEKLTSLTLPSSVTTIGSNVFAYCRGLTSADLSNCILLASVGGNLFANCSGLISADLSNCTRVTTMGDYAFSYCNNITSIALPSSLTKIGAYMFESCTSLTTTTIPQNVTTIGSYAFYNCRGLTSITLPRSMTNIGSYTFQNCSGLITLTCEKGSRISNSATNVFANCTNLTNLTLRNISQKIQIGSTSWGHLLTLESLLNTIKELWTNTSGTKTLTMGTANLEKLANMYVKLIDITEEMRAEDEYIDNKAPFEVCESTDAGAMLVTEYVTTLKKWSLA